MPDDRRPWGRTLRAIDHLAGQVQTVPVIGHVAPDPVPHAPIAPGPLAPAERSSLERPAVERRQAIPPIRTERDLIRDATRAAAKVLAHITHGTEGTPVLAVTEAPFKNGVVLHITARLSEAAVDQLMSLAAALAAIDSTPPR